MSQLRVLWVAKGLGPGGMERLLVHHARVGNRGRFRYVVAYVMDRPASVVPELEDLGVECIWLDPEDRGSPHWAGALLRLVRSLNIDVVHHHSPLPAALSRPVLRASSNRPGLIYTEHNTWDCYGSSTRIVNALTYPLDDAQFAVSEAVRASVPSVLRRRVERLTHGIDLAEVRRLGKSRNTIRDSLGLSARHVLVANVAHLRREKGQDVLMAAAAQVVRRFDNVTFLSVGHGPLRDELRALHGELELGDRFRFLGFREDANSILAASDVFCLSSRQEGLPVAFMEACALGVPAVMTSVGGLPEYVDNGRSGLLVPPDDATALAQALGRLIGDSDLRESIGATAAAKATVFDARGPVRRQESVYERLGVERRSRRC